MKSLKSFTILAAGLSKLMNAGAALVMLVKPSRSRRSRSPSVQESREEISTF